MLRPHIYFTSFQLRPNVAIRGSFIVDLRCTS